MMQANDLHPRLLEVECVCRLSEEVSDHDHPHKPVRVQLQVGNLSDFSGTHSQRLSSCLPTGKTRLHILRRVSLRSIRNVVTVSLLCKQGVSVLTGSGSPATFAKVVR